MTSSNLTSLICLLMVLTRISNGIINKNINGINTASNDAVKLYSYASHLFQQNNYLGT